MRIQGRLKLGYYPIPASEVERIKRFFGFPSEQCQALDPCSGTGAAFKALTAGGAVRTYGIELDAYRAAETGEVLDEVVHGSIFDTHAPVESFSLIYLNPPYDFEIGEGKNRRMERLFLEHVARWLKPGGVLVFVLPFDRVYDCRGILTTQFRDKAIYRLTEPESVAYKQFVLFGVRRSRQERERLTDRAVSDGNWKLQQLTRVYDEIPALPDEADRQYPVPPAPPVKLEYRGLPLDQIEDALEVSPAWRQAQRITHAPKAEFSGRPLTPLHKGHVGLLCTSGLLNGVFGTGSERHVAYWESVKVVDRIEEAGVDAGITVVREKERFSQRLTLLYADGRIALLSERPASGKKGDAQDDERTFADGPADLRAANTGYGGECFDPPASPYC
jgi:tRNA1(Val) A37 N6-methylase TrmN6